MPAAEEIYLLDETAVLLLIEWFTFDFLYHILLLSYLCIYIYRASQKTENLKK